MALASAGGRSCGPLPVGAGFPGVGCAGQSFHCPETSLGSLWFIGTSHRAPGLPAMVASAELACLGFSFNTGGNWPKPVVCRRNQVFLISAAVDTQKESDRSFFRKWATCPEGAWGRTLKVWCPARGHSGAGVGRRGALCLCSALLLFCQNGIQV